MSTATKRGKLLPDLLVAREALLPSTSHAIAGRATEYADLDAFARSRPGVLKWILVKRVDAPGDSGAASNDVPRPLKSNVPGPPVRHRRAADGKRAPTVSANAAGRVQAEAIFCEKGDAIPAVARPWCWDYENLGDPSLKSGSCGRRAKSKSRQNSP